MQSRSQRFLVLGLGLGLAALYLWHGDEPTIKIDGCSSLYKEPGIFEQVMDGTVEVAQWRPYNGRVPPDYVRAIRGLLKTGDHDQYATPSGPNLNLDFLRNKTILDIGDSLDMRHVRFFCQLFGRERAITTHSVDELTAQEGEDRGQTNRCYIEELDLTFRSIMNYGFLTDEHFWDFKPSGVIHPVKTMDRLPIFLDAMDRNKQTIDAVLLHSGLWDLAYVNTERALAADPRLGVLKGSELSRYTRGMQDVVSYLKQRLPKASIMGRGTVYTTESLGSWFLIGLDLKGAEPIARSPFQNSKVFQLNQAAQFVLKENDLRYIPWGELMLGQKVWIDDIHPSYIPNYLYANIWLTHLKELFEPEKGKVGEDC